MQVIFNADDFGRSASVNAAVERAHREGVLTSASLMVTGDAVDEAVRLATTLPRLAVGLHIVIADGRSALPAYEIPHLVDRRGRFAGDPVVAGLRCFLSAAARADLRRELEAQFKRFAATGLRLSHVDSHFHMHMHPTVFGDVTAMAQRHGAIGCRLPHDDVRVALRYSRRRAGVKLAWAVIYAVLSRGRSSQLEELGLVYTDRVYGLMQTGAMSADYVTLVLRQISVNSAEVYFHPAMESPGEPMGPNPGDLATLVSAEVREAIRSRGLKPATYASLRSV